MSKNLDIAKAVAMGISQRKVSVRFNVSRDTVALIVRHAQAKGWTSLDLLETIDETIFSSDFEVKPTRSRETAFQMPDYEWVHKELGRPHVTLQLLWEEYVDRCRAAGQMYYMETSFRRYYHAYVKRNRATIRLVHKPGFGAEVDWAGTKMTYYGEDEADFLTASLFVSCLPCSQLIYAEPFRNEKMESWIQGHNHAFQYFGGVPKTLVPDNLRTGVTHSNFYEPAINRTYQELADHYGCVVLPARVRKSNDKASVESSVRTASTRIIAKLRNLQLLSFDDLQRAVAQALEAINHRAMRKTNESRWTAYLAEEQSFMLPLPSTPYTHAVWKTAIVQADCHLAFDNKFYSVPFEYVGEEITLRASATAVTLFYHGEKIAAHDRLLGKQPYATATEHLPPHKIFYATVDAGSLLKMAGTIGPWTKKATQALLDQAVLVEQSYRMVLGLLNLQKKYSADRLEVACHRVLSSGAKVSYSYIKSYLDKNLDQQPGHPSIQEMGDSQKQAKGYQRGATYWEDKT